METLKNILMLIIGVSLLLKGLVTPEETWTTFHAISIPFFGAICAGVGISELIKK